MAKKISITDTVFGEHIMECDVVAETHHIITIQNGRKTYTMNFCKKTGRHLNPLDGLQDCLILADFITRKGERWNDDK